jgi:hypothetical protein
MISTANKRAINWPGCRSFWACVGKTPGQPELVQPAYADRTTTRTRWIGLMPHFVVT